MNIMNVLGSQCTHTFACVVLAIILSYSVFVRLRRTHRHSWCTTTLSTSISLRCHPSFNCTLCRHQKTIKKWHNGWIDRLPSVKESDGKLTCLAAQDRLDRHNPFRGISACQSWLLFGIEMMYRAVTSTTLLYQFCQTIYHAVTCKHTMLQRD